MYCRSRIILVELIVVLVILAILAAMLVPALLGWIDEAKKKQYELEARSVYMAAQAIADEQFAAGKEKQFNPSAEDVETRLKELATDVTDPSILTTDLVLASNENDGTKNCFKITGMSTTFTSGSKTVTMKLADGKWSKTGEKDAASE